MLKEIWLDTETTGLSSWRNGIWQLAGQIIIDNEVMEEFNYKIAPLEKDELDPEALKLNNLTPAILKGFDNPSMTKRSFCNMLDRYVNKFERSDKLTLYAFNARFDDDFIRDWFKKLGDKYYGSYFFFPPIDVMNIAADKLKHERSSMKDFKLITVAKKLGIKVEEEKFHDALYDIIITRKIYSACKAEQVEMFETIPVTKEASIVKRKGETSSD